MKMPSHMRNLTRASAKHLLAMGHISQAHHDKIMAASGAGVPGIGGTPAVPGVTNGMGNILPPGFMADDS